MCLPYRITEKGQGSLARTPLPQFQDAEIMYKPWILGISFWTEKKFADAVEFCD